MARRLNDARLHSFVLAGFDSDVLRYAILSNNQTLNGDIRPLATELLVDARTTTGTHVFVTGLRDTVTEENRRLLEHLAESADDFVVIQHHLAAIHREAAQPNCSDNGVSEACLTYTCSRDGKQWSKLHGDVIGSLVPVAAEGSASWA